MLVETGLPGLVDILASRLDLWANVLSKIRDLCQHPFTELLLIIASSHFIVQSEIKRCHLEHRFIADQQSDNFVYLLFLEKPPFYFPIFLRQVFSEFLVFL